MANDFIIRVTARGIMNRFQKILGKKNPVSSKLHPDGTFEMEFAYSRRKYAEAAFIKLIACQDPGIIRLFENGKHSVELAVQQSQQN